jgi:hypothetical protein
LFDTLKKKVPYSVCGRVGGVNYKPLLSQRNQALNQCILTSVECHFIEIYCVS